VVAGEKIPEEGGKEGAHRKKVVRCLSNELCIMFFKFIHLRIVQTFFVEMLSNILH